MVRSGWCAVLVLLAVVLGCGNVRSGGCAGLVLLPGLGTGSGLVGLWTVLFAVVGGQGGLGLWLAVDVSLCRAGSGVGAVFSLPFETGANSVRITMPGVVVRDCVPSTA